MRNTLQVGQSYTSHNGSEWECIFVRDGKAWMIGVYSDGAHGTAYVFNIEGTAEWAGGHGAEGYNIKWGPMRETVSIPFLPNKDNKGEWCYLTVETIDGTPDWTTAKVTPCE